MTEQRPIGKVYNIAPQPHDESNTQWIDAGVVRIGVEYRDVSPEDLEALYSRDAAELAELREKSPVGGFSDEGVSLHIAGTVDGHEYLRFDVFDGEPHYHYVHKVVLGGEVTNQVIDFDAAAEGDMLEWALARIATRLPQMLTAAGGAELAGMINQSELSAALDQVARLATAAQSAYRAGRDGKDRR